MATLVGQPNFQAELRPKPIVRAERAHHSPAARSGASKEAYGKLQVKAYAGLTPGVLNWFVV